MDHPPLQAQFFKLFCQPIFARLNSCYYGQKIAFLNPQITVPRVCELSGLSKSYLYHNKKAKKLFDEAKTLAEKKARLPHISSYELESANLDINPHMHHKGMLLQYEEMKRKLYETYMITIQLIKAENDRLIYEIDKDKRN